MIDTTYLKSDQAIKEFTSYLRNKVNKEKMILRRKKYVNEIIMLFTYNTYV